MVDSEDQDLDAVGNVLYREICGIMRSPWSQDFGGRFARSLALVLMYTCSSSNNKAMLLDPSIFGTDTLSKLIIDAKDYHYLDTLLELSFTMFSSQGGKVTRKTYADSIFRSGYALENLLDDISNELVSIHSVTNGGNSEKHALDIMRTMPQVFTTKDLSYCGTRLTQTPPSNVIILDHKNLCVVFCDKNGENDVLAVAATTIKSLELVPQDVSRVIAELVVGEPPLISSSREELATPDSHIPGSPLKIRLSIASSDVSGFEAALAARDLAGVIKDDNALIRHSSLAGTKISYAVFGVSLPKNSNPSNEQAEEMIRKYVNLPSSREASSPSPPPVERSETTRAAQQRPLPPRAPVTPITATRPQTEKPRPADKPTPGPTDTTPVRPAGTATTRTKRTAAEKSQKAIKLAALADLDGSELTEPDSGTPLEHPRRQTVANTPAEDAAALPTPPHTRARAQPTKSVAKTLVPTTPTVDRTPQVSSPPDVPSPSPKPIKKRKLVEDDPFDFPPLNSEHPTKQKKTEAAIVPSNSQHIRPRDTAATRAKAKYGTISKRMRASSPVESIQSADTEEDGGPPQKKASAPTKGKKQETARMKSATMTETQRRAKKNDKPNPPKRQTRASAAKSKPTIETVVAAQNKVSDKSTTEDEVAESVELPKKRGRPPKNRSTQQPVKLPEPPSEAVDSIKPVPPQPEPHHKSSNEIEPTSIDGRDKIELAPTIAPETTVATHEQAPEDDDLLRRLSQAAKKALRPPLVDSQLTISPRRSPSPTKTLEVEMECPEVDVVTVLPAQDLETPSAEGAFYQTQDAILKPLESPETDKTTKPPSGRLEEGSKTTSTSIEVPTEHPDVPGTRVSKFDQHPSTTQTSTGLRVTKDALTDSAHNGTFMDSLEKNSTPLSTPSTRNAIDAATQQNPKPTPIVARVEAIASNLQEHKPIVSLENLGQPMRIAARIREEKTQATVTRTPVRQVETPPTKDAHRTKFPPVFISVDLTDSDVEMEPSQEPVLRRPSVMTSRTKPTTRPGVKSQSHPVPAPAKVKHVAVTRVLFDTSTQPSPKSALASPQRRTLANGTRPSVSFLEPPAPISRRGSSGSSTEGTQNQRTHGINRQKLREEHSAHTGDVIIQIVDIMTEIQETIASNLGKKIETVNAEARSARAELTKSLIEKLDNMKAEAEFHHKTLHKFESAFARQAQAMLEGLSYIVERNDRMNNGIEGILAANARAGQGIAGNTLNFEVPELFSAFLAS
ncbi:unnamed protein product [Rhizoctonia solani]|uniref:Uncharacterized protein n=1 Tax=Rhizoctonia solani TaxID=456999 RepID=A0A8H2WJB1_9AGAM|nr:unnamed protein product [Rhizoctonia solani]